MQPLPKIYFVPGLGADRRLFAGLREAGLPFEVLEYFRPHRRESLREYAHRLAEGIDQRQPFVIGGVSLGGIMSMEIAKITQPEKVIAISTVKNSREFPFYLHTFRYLPLWRLVSGRFMIRNAPKEKRDLMLPHHALLLEEMREDADPYFVKWAVREVLHWRNREVPENVLHIHGTRDNLFPKRFIRDHLPVEGGTHVMVLTHADEIAQAIRSELRGLPVQQTS